VGSGAELLPKSNSVHFLKYDSAESYNIATIFVTFLSFQYPFLPKILSPAIVGWVPCPLPCLRHCSVSRRFEDEKYSVGFEKISVVSTLHH